MIFTWLLGRSCTKLVFLTFQTEGDSFLVISTHIFSPRFEYLSNAEDKILERFFPFI